MCNNEPHIRIYIMYCMLLPDISIFNIFILFFNVRSPTEIYTLSLHDALPIWRAVGQRVDERRQPQHAALRVVVEERRRADRKSTRLNSSHRCISYAVFCLKKKKKENILTIGDLG